MSRKFSKKWIVIILLVTILIPAWLYRFSFFSYFFQDDWFSFRISNAKNLGDFLSFFIPRQDVIYYRPLGMQVPFFILGKIFGLNPFVFRIVTYITHTINIVLVFILARLLLKKEKLALLVAFLYGTSAVHFLIFYWFAIYAFIAGPTAFFLSFILYILYLQRKKNSYYFLSFIIFVCGLLTNEIVAVLPLILFTYDIFLHKSISIKRLLPYFLSVVMMLILRFVFFAPPSTGVYQLSIGKHIFSNLKTYVFWSFNWSEILTEQMVRIFVFNDKITSEYSHYALLALITFMIIVFIFYISPITVMITSKKIKSFFPLTLFGISWFVLGLLPVLFFPDHKFSYYLPISLVGLLIVPLSFFGYLIKLIYLHTRWLSYIFVSLLVIVWLWITSATVDFNSQIHWAPRRAKLAKILADKAKKQMISQIYLSNKIYIPSSAENKLALNDQDGLIVTFGRKDIVTVYSEKK